MLIPVCDMFRWFVPIPIFVDTDMSMLLPRLTRFDGSMFSFLFGCMFVVLPLLDPRLQIPFSICFFWAMPELILLITLLTPPTRCKLEFEGRPEPDRLGLSFDDF